MYFIKLFVHDFTFYAFYNVGLLLLLLLLLLLFGQRIFIIRNTALHLQIILIQNHRKEETSGIYMATHAFIDMNPDHILRSIS